MMKHQHIIRKRLIALKDNEYDEVLHIFSGDFEYLLKVGGSKCFGFNSKHDAVEQARMDSRATPSLCTLIYARNLGEDEYLFKFKIPLRKDDEVKVYEDYSVLSDKDGSNNFFIASAKLTEKFSLSYRYPKIRMCIRIIWKWRFWETF